MPIYMLIGGLVRRDMRAMLASGKLVRFAVMFRLNRIIDRVLLGRNGSSLIGGLLTSEKVLVRGPKVVDMWLD
jgi:hypothetical protein